MDLRFNTVLIPPQDIHSASIHFAQEHFAKDHMGYCLGSNGHLPHVTLAQTTLPDTSCLKELIQDIDKLSSNTIHEINFLNYYHEERGYCGVEIEKNNQLQEIHEKIVSIHEKYSLPIHNSKVDKYWPHLTIAMSQKKLSRTVVLPNKLQKISRGWKVEFGHMGDHGVYLGGYNEK